MHRIKQSYVGTAAAIGCAALLRMPATGTAQAQAPAAVAIDNDDIGGVVRGPGGPEAGAWVIAETRDLPTRFTRSVVTDDQGRYLIPDLPKAKYKVWVRGYGLVDSPKADSEPGRTLNLRATPAPNAAAAAEYYPSGYWYALMKFPDKSEFPGTGDNGNRIPTSMRSQHQWLDSIKTNGCWGCHGLGNKATRTNPEDLGSFRNSPAAWTRGFPAGQAMRRL